MLYDIDEERVYCGPGALIAVTGKRLPEIRAAINGVRGLPESTGVCRLTVSKLIGTLKALGIEHFNYDHEPPTHVRTLQKFVEDPFWCVPDRTYIIPLSTHFVAVCGGRVVDNHIRFGCPVEEHPYRRSHVKGSIWIKTT